MQHRTLTAGLVLGCHLLVRLWRDRRWMAVTDFAGILAGLWAFGSVFDLAWTSGMTG